MGEGEGFTRTPPFESFSFIGSTFGSALRPNELSFRFPRFETATVQIDYITLSPASSVGLTTTTTQNNATRQCRRLPIHSPDLLYRTLV